MAHTQLVAILEDKSEAVSSQNGKVVLDLKPIVYQLADRLGFKKQVANAVAKGEETGNLKPGFGELEVADSQELDTARTVTKILNGLAWFFTIGSLALFVLAMWLGKGRDWVIVLGYGLGLIAAGLGAIAVRAILKGPFVDSLAKTEDARVPAQHAWDIGTSLLHSIASSVIIYGILFVIASYLASPQNGAVSIRQALAPTLRDRPGIVWSVFAAVALLVLIVWPPNGTRQLVLTLLLFALAGAGIEKLVAPRGASSRTPSAATGWATCACERGGRARRPGVGWDRRSGSSARTTSTPMMRSSTASRSWAS